MHRDSPSTHTHHQDDWAEEEYSINHCEGRGEGGVCMCSINTQSDEYGVAGEEREQEGVTSLAHNQYECSP